MFYYCKRVIVVLLMDIRIRKSDKCKGYVILREEKREGEKRFRRIIGSAGVDAILSSIPHQLPPGNLYPPAVLSFSRFHRHPISYPRSARDRGEYQAAVSFQDRNRRKLVNGLPRAAQIAFKEPLGILAHSRLCFDDIYVRDLNLL